MRSLFSIVVVFLLIPAFAGADGNCTQGVQTTRNLQIQTYSILSHSQNAVTPQCTIMLAPVNAPTSYRIYNISQNGMVQVFNDYNLNNPNPSKSTGARTYFFFPRKTIPRVGLSSGEGGFVQVTTSSGVALKFDAGAVPSGSTAAVSPTLISESGDPIVAIVSPDVVPTNAGGVELQQTPASGTLILDTGFMLGEAAFTDQAANSKFVDPRGNECVVKNSEIFSYPGTGEPQIAYSADADLWGFLARRCPNLNLPPIE